LGTAYIVKPVRRAELLAAIATALAGRNRANVAGAVAQPHAAAGDTAALARAPATPPLAAQAEPAAATSSARLLVVDDSADNRLLISGYLKRMPYRIDEAQDGEEAFNKAIATRYDLILMDLQMPVVHGLEATRMIRGWERSNGVARTPIIALTASVLEDDVRKTLAAGADAHLSKPVSRGMLLQAIRELNEIDATDGEAVSNRDNDLAALPRP
jgi:CheY-like chemotaxis protein